MDLSTLFLWGSGLYVCSVVLWVYFLWRRYFAQPKVSRSELG